MAQVTHGSDIDALRRLAEDMLNHAEYTLGVGLNIQRGLTELRWSGPDAERARQHWESVELPRIRTISRAVAEAAGHVLAQVEQQRAASEADAVVSAPGTPAPAASAPAAPASGGGDTRDLAARAALVLDILTNGPELAQVAAVVAAGGRGALAMTESQYALVSSMIAAVRPIGGEVVRVAGQVGTAVDVYDAAVGLYTGDYDQATEGVGGLAAGLVGGPAVGAAWGGGYAVGGLINDAMEGTEYEEHFRRRNEVAFEEFGAGGMLFVPGNLAVAAWDTLTSDDDGDPDNGAASGSW